MTAERLDRAQNRYPHTNTGVQPHITLQGVVLRKEGEVVVKVKPVPSLKEGDVVDNNVPGLR